MTNKRSLSEDAVAAAVREVHRYGPTGVFTKRQYLTHKIILDGTSYWLAIEAVASVAIEHPEWNMDEEQTWEEWERRAS